MIKIRPAAGLGTTIDEAMSRVVEIEDWEDLFRYLKREYDFWQPTDENVEIKFYCQDKRIGWNTYLVTIDGKAAVFTNGPVQPEHTQSEGK